MTNAQKIEAIRARQRLLMNRGPHNSKIVAKLERQIRRLSQEE